MSTPLLTFTIDDIEFDLAAATISKKVLEVVQCPKNKHSNFKIPWMQGSKIDARVSR